MTTVASISLPTTLAERLEWSADTDRIPASFEEFVALIEKAEYPIEYENGEIIIMSIASEEHEKLVANLLGIFFVALKSQREYSRFSSNRHIYIPSLQKAYSPDASVLKGESEEFEYAKGKSSYTNPWLVAEVISPSSRNRDFGEKLQGYKAIPSLAYILYLEQDRPFVTLFERIADSDRWKSTDYNDLEQEFKMGSVTVTMKDLYEKPE